MNRRVGSQLSYPRTDELVAWSLPTTSVLYTIVHESYLNISGMFYIVLLQNMRETCTKHV